MKPATITSVEIVVTQYPDLSDDARWKVLIQENVLVQVENLRTHPCVAAGLARNELRLHAWVYKMETGHVFAYDHASGQFGPIQEVAVPTTKESGRQRAAGRSI